MKLLLPILFAALLCGCVSKSRSQVRAYEAYIAGQRDASARTQTPPITVAGDVKNHTVPWVDGLTLAQGLLAAEYNGPRDPHQIALTRAGETYKINVKAFLAGGEDPPLQPGDIITVKR